MRARKREAAAEAAEEHSRRNLQPVRGDRRRERAGEATDSQRNRRSRVWRLHKERCKHNCAYSFEQRSK